jgi:hypothetical protein
MANDSKPPFSNYKSAALPAELCRRETRRTLPRHNIANKLSIPHPFTLPIGVNRTTGLLIPANAVASITSSMSL